MESDDYTTLDGLPAKMFFFLMDLVVLVASVSRELTCRDLSPLASVGARR